MSPVFPSRASRSRRRARRGLFMWFVGACFLLGGLVILWAASLKIPDLSSLEDRRVEQSLKIYDRTGEVLLYDLNKDIDRTIVPISEIAPFVQHATLAMEDPTFYENAGVVPTAILRAILADLTPGGVVQGGSTITQQVVKGSLLTGDKTVTRKLKEWVLALKLTKVLPKERILELYLNQAPYGGNIYGVEGASERFFGKHASEVTLLEAAYLAAVLPAPTYYSPYGNHQDALHARKNLVLDKMFEHGYITASERDAAKETKASFSPPKETAIQAPHFIFYVEQYLEEKYGEDALRQNGWSIVTTLDADLQKQAEQIVSKHAITNTENFNASNAGLIALNPENGQILVMVGSRNYFDPDIDGNFNVTLANRQPGSAFKPFAYAAALKKGYTPDTVLFDVPTQFQVTCEADNFTSDDGCYSPSNYDDEFRGPMTLRSALAQSINVPSIKVLYLAGLSETLKLAKSMGITTLTDVNRYGLTLVLGGGEVTLLDISSAYGVFAQDGIRVTPISVLRIEDKEGNVIEDNSRNAGVRVLPASVAEQINDILSDPIARAPLGENHLLSFPGRDVAVKTGTTNDYRDAWTVGYTPNLVVGVWAGNNDNSSMEKRVSGFIVGPMWSEFVRYALAQTSYQAFSRSDIALPGEMLKPVMRGVWQGGNSTIVDSRTGAPATFQTPENYLQERVLCDPHSILYWVDKNNPFGSAPLGDSRDAQYPFWEKGVGLWAENHGCVKGTSVVVGSATPLMLRYQTLATSTPSQ